MIRTYLFAPLLLAIVCSITPASASITLSLDPGSIDMHNLTVGDTVTLDVLLGGLGGVELSSLGGTVAFSAAHFGTPQNSSAGSIFSVPADPNDLVLQEFPGQQDAQFISFLGGHLTTEGQFFSFELTAATAGSGTIAFAPFSLFAEDDQSGPIFDIQTNEISYSIDGGQQVIPEPASFVVWPLLAATALGLVKRRKHLLNLHAGRA